jgi:hypothetical protein
MAGVGPPQELLIREIRDAGGGHELAGNAGALDQRGVRPLNRQQGSSKNGAAARIDTQAASSP